MGSPEVIQKCVKCGLPGHLKRNCSVKVMCNRCGTSDHIERNLCVKLKQSYAILHMKVVSLNNLNKSNVFIL